MKNFLKFMLFFLYLIGIFFLEDFRILLLFLVLNGCLMKLWQIDLKIFLKSVKVLLPFVVFTGVINIIFGDWKRGMLIIVRLLQITQATYIFSKSMTAVEFAKVIQNLAYPLKIVKVNNEEIAMIVQISLCVLPILKAEIQQKKDALKAKGLELKLRNCLVILKPLFISIFRRTNEMEKSLKAKGY